MKRFLFSCCILLAAFGCSPNFKCPDTSGPEICTRILFIGNSYTFTNDLPDMFSKLAFAGGKKVETGMIAPAGWSLSDHDKSSETLGKLSSSKWDFVVLQEQSEIPAFEQSRNSGMFPAARELVSQIRNNGSTPIFFITWAHRDGMPENRLPDYETMQFQIDIGYLRIAQELSVKVAPVGYVWLLVKDQNPSIDLWQKDGSHPSEEGTYLAACVFFAVIFHKNPAGLTYMAHLSKETAHYLQQIAGNTVLNNPSEWNLP